MYFKMTGGTNRGFVFRNGTVNVAQIDGSGNIYTNGKIGIGVSSAEKLLHVNSVNTHAALFENSGPYWDVLFKVTDGVADKRIWGMGAVNNGTTDTAFVLGTMVDSYASTERIRVTQDGKVGIGTATPAETLHVAGNLKVDGSINGSLGTVTFTKYQIVYNSTEDSLDFVYTG
jgi:hypothetical protein